jgi:hypothetical protein
MVRHVVYLGDIGQQQRGRRHSVVSLLQGMRIEVDPQHLTSGADAVDQCLKIDTGSTAKIQHLMPRLQVHEVDAQVLVRATAFGPRDSLEVARKRRIHGFPHRRRLSRALRVGGAFHDTIAHPAGRSFIRT